jgi:hypothetical protein
LHSKQAPGTGPGGHALFPAETILMRRLSAMRVDSTAIRQIDYEPEHGKLFVTFHDGDEYVYVGVPPRITEAFTRAPSKGRFFQRMIRDRYPYNRV